MRPVHGTKHNRAQHPHPNTPHDTRTRRQGQGDIEMTLNVSEQAQPQASKALSGTQKAPLFRWNGIRDEKGAELQRAMYIATTIRFRIGYQGDCPRREGI